jgi:hypothetical protein
VRITPDDEVYRVDAVWLGPQGATLPWAARYSAYGIWVTLFVGVLIVEAILPMRVTIPPVWELVTTILGTYAVTGIIDHDRPLISVWQLARAELRAPRPKVAPPVLVTTKLRVRTGQVRLAGGGRRDAA